MALIVVAYTSPFWLDWRLITVGVLVYYAQLIIFGWCVLSTAQFGEKKTFHEWYLSKLGVHPNPKTLKFFLDFIIPPVLVFVAINIQ
ncbi:hypothetical protein IPP75_05470 [Candidatus Saccharibacteria bacterium]|nr:MAG: hypothetical protein IPP75_05470 [Candidatus Saccharibacteria bacterium]